LRVIHHWLWRSDDRQSLPNPRQVVDLVRREAAGPVGHERDHVIDGMYAGDRQRQIIGAAALPQLEQHLEIELITDRYRAFLVGVSERIRHSLPA
jgi:hypothetical protein